MPINDALANKIWSRYVFARDNGHSAFTKKADKCERFFAGDQWDKADKQRLIEARRPAITVNKIMSTLSNVMGEQIYNRAEISFRPRSGAPEEVAGILTKVFKQISDNNQLDWKRSDMFADGIITSRGYLDVRLDYSDSMQGEVRIENLNPKNVIPDPDAESADPDTWNEVHTTKWLTADDIAVLYSKADAKILRNREASAFPYGYDSIEDRRDRFGEEHNPSYAGDTDQSDMLRNIRVIERQYRKLDRQKFFVTPGTGDMRAVPDSFDRDRIALFVNLGFQVVTELVRRIRWTVVADNVVLHDDWSPYKHFTVIPFFPHFRRGNTIGLVENLLGPQELLNKSTSQELHIINTTANSGWIVKNGALNGMTAGELEAKGATTGLVIEINGGPNDSISNSIEKITPNAVPTGLDRVGFKAEESIKTISGVSDSMQGFDREDVAAKAIQAKRQAGSTNLVKPLDSLTRSDYWLARATLDLVQEFYTEERLLSITHDNLSGDTETFSVNKADAYGKIENDLTIGEYAIVVSSVPRRETLEDSQFEQAVALREMGIPIPDSVLLDSSRLINKSDILKQMQAAQESPEAQAAAALAKATAEAELAKTQGEAQNKTADAQLKGAKTRETMVKADVLAKTPIDAGGENMEVEVALAEHEMELEDKKFEHEVQLDAAKMQHEMELDQQKLKLEAQAQAQARAEARVAQQQQAAQANSQPAKATPKGPK